MSYTDPTLSASLTNPTSAQPNCHDEQARAGFARRMVFAIFRRRDAVALDYDGFVDRAPGDAPIFAAGISARAK